MSPITVSLTPNVDSFWKSCFDLEHEMTISTTHLRRLYPRLEYTVTELNPTKMYSMSVHMELIDDYKNMKFSRGKWIEMNSTEVEEPRHQVCHQIGAQTGEYWMENNVHFFQIRITTHKETADKNPSFFCLHYCRRYIPVLTIREGSEVVHTACVLYTQFVPVSKYHNETLKALKTQISQPSIPVKRRPTSDDVTAKRGKTVEEESDLEQFIQNLLTPMTSSEDKENADEDFNDAANTLITISQGDSRRRQNSQTVGVTPKGKKNRKEVPDLGQIIQNMLIPMTSSEDKENAPEPASVQNVPVKTKSSTSRRRQSLVSNVVTPKQKNTPKADLERIIQNMLVPMTSSEDKENAPGSNQNASHSQIVLDQTANTSKAIFKRSATRLRLTLKTNDVLTPLTSSENKENARAADQSVSHNQVILVAEDQTATTLKPSSNSKRVVALRRQNLKTNDVTPKRKINPKAEPNLGQIIQNMLIPSISSGDVQNLSGSSPALPPTSSLQNFQMFNPFLPFGLQNPFLSMIQSPFINQSETENTTE